MNVKPLFGYRIRIMIRIMNVKPLFGYRIRAMIRMMGVKPLFGYRIRAVIRILQKTRLNSAGSLARNLLVGQLEQAARSVIR